MAAKKKAKSAKKGKKAAKRRLASRKKVVKRKKKVTQRTKARAKKKVAKKKRKVTRRAKAPARKKVAKKKKKVAKKKVTKKKKKVVKKKRKVARRAKAPARKKGKKTAPAPAKVMPVTPAPRPLLNEERVGVVTHYYTHLGVAVVYLDAGVLREGDTIRIKGHTSDFTQKGVSMEIDHLHVREVRPGQSFGLKVKEHAREHDVVYRVTIL